MDAQSPQNGGPAEWFIDQQGKPIGPLSLEQVLSSYHEARITGTTRITAKRLGGQWISVQEWIEFFGRSAQPTPPKLNLPARPDNVNERTMSIEVGSLRKKPDAAENLFDALHAVKEKQVQQEASFRKDRRVWGEGPTKKKVPVQVWIAAASIAMLSAVVWSLAKMLDRKVESKPESSQPGSPIQARDLANAGAAPAARPTAPQIAPPRSFQPRVAPQAAVVVKSARDEEREREEQEERERERLIREAEIKARADQMGSQYPQEQRDPASLDSYPGSDSPVPPDQPPPPPRDPNEHVPDHSHPADPLNGGRAID